MNFKDFYDIDERYGGAAKERGIWYHGTSMKRVPKIMSRGLDPDIPQKNRSWDKDPHVDASNLDKSSYGGVYVTQNLMTAVSSATRTARKDDTTQAIIIMELQPRSLVGDEDDFSLRMKNLGDNVAGSAYHAVYPYMWEMYGAPDYHKEYATETKNKWCSNVAGSYFYKLGVGDVRLKKHVEKLLYDYGYKAMLIRTVAFIEKGSKYDSDYWHWRKAYAEVNGLKDYDLNVDIPDPPKPQEGEKVFRAFVDRLTRTMKHAARHNFTDKFSKTARSLNHIGFHGSNKIIGVVELVRSKTVEYSEDIKILYGNLPDEFRKEWVDRVGELRIVQ